MILIMTENKSEKECMFFVSDYHFEMITLLNIKRELKEKRRVVILTQNDLTKSVELVLSRINLEENERAEFKKINWTKECKEKLNNIYEIINRKEKLTVYIKGDSDFIFKENEKIKNIINEQVKVIDCYDYNLIGENEKDITKKYGKRVITKE